ELTFGDNDMLSALVSGFIHADELIILTDVNGIYDKNPKLHANAQKISNLNVITDQMILSTEISGSNVETGGMKSKLVAIKRDLSLGTSVLIEIRIGENK